MSRKSISDSSSVEPGAEPDEDFDEAPELDGDFFERAQISFKGHIIREANGTLTKRGRPPLGDAAKVQQSLRLSPEVLDYFRSTGPGWQARIDEVLRIHVRMVGEMRRSVAEAMKAEPRLAEEQERFRGGRGKRPLGGQSR
ncbi:MAG TPA: BrnA antitoxin family protein [Allosphingosinicella sp.]|jgi:uncharacterized protein (DUF4415 family)|nr:BrnA antitoxin family protein [Allosphingosinicella sp.]